MVEPAIRDVQVRYPHLVRAPVRARNLASSENMRSVEQSLELPSTVTDKERQVVDLYERGMSQRSIAIFLSVRTVQLVEPAGKRKRAAHA
jgi:hypothetical protein